MKVHFPCLSFRRGIRLSYDIPGGLPPILSLTALGLAGAFLITLKGNGGSEKTGGTP